VHEHWQDRVGILQWWWTCNALRMSFMVPSVVALGLPLGRERVAHQYPWHRNSRGRWSTAVPWFSQRSSQVYYESQFGNVYCWVRLGSASNVSRRPATFTRETCQLPLGAALVPLAQGLHWLLYPLARPIASLLVGLLHSTGRSNGQQRQGRYRHDEDGIDASPVASALSTI
jgi:hypothetical protein